MIALLLMPADKVYGNVQWYPPYVYPQEYTDAAIESLRGLGYWVSLFPEGDGITFTIKDKSHDHIRDDFANAFPWIKFVLTRDDMVQSTDQIIILPLQRLVIDQPIISSGICLFPPGKMQISKMKLLNLDGEPVGKESSHLRDKLTDLTNVSSAVFTDLPVAVLRTNISHLDFLKLSHHTDTELIRRCSQQADDLFDLLRLYEADYYLPDKLPAKAGICNDRHSAMLIYFPLHGIGHLLAREVEAKNFTRGIGMEFTRFKALELHPLIHFSDALGETGLIARQALRLHTSVQEQDDYTLKFMQAMILFEMIADPENFQKFERVKWKLISVLAKNSRQANKLSERFKALTGGIEDQSGKKELGLRTKIVHTGKRLTDLLDAPQIKELMYELQGYAYELIQDMIWNSHLTWEHYDKTRELRRQEMMTNTNVAN